ncbi:chemotaxis protein CheW [Microvirga sp. TS319]|uniref:chemotaxis protein CheW n=1 Tax=Microvirga sp. TS319 TaxID=3241165 RepID=UPI00351A5A3C
MQILLFDVCGIACALRSTSVRELLPVPRLWCPPALPRPVAGFFNLGGAAVPVIRLDVLLRLRAEPTSSETNLYRHLIMLDGLSVSGPAALLVDRVRDVADIHGAQVSPVPPESSLNGCVEAEIDHQGQLLHLLSLERLLFAEEKLALDELSSHARTRLGEWMVSA